MCGKVKGVEREEEDKEWRNGALGNFCFCFPWGICGKVRLVEREKEDKEWGMVLRVIVVFIFHGEWVKRWGVLSFGKGYRMEKWCWGSLLPFLPMGDEWRD
jgi:hypothetical protein